MEAFSLLKYWRGGGGGGAVSVAGDGGANVRTATSSITTIVTAVSHHSSETDEEDGDDDGPFFDLEFAVPDEDEGDERVKNEENEGGNSAEEYDEGKDDDTDSDESDGENESELKFTLSSASSGDSTDLNVSLSPSDDLFFKGRLVPIEPSPLVLNGFEPNSKSQFPVSLLKSATKFRVLMLKLKKSKSNVSEKTESNGSASVNPQQQQKPQPENKEQQKSQSQGKFFTVKFKVEEVPIVSLFTRDNSSKSATTKAQKQNSDESVSDEKRFSKDVMQRYLRKVKPLYVRASKRYGEKLRFSGQLSLTGAVKAGLSPPPPTAAHKSSTAGKKSPPATETAAKSETEALEASPAPPPSNVKSLKQGNLPAGLRVVCKHLGKSRSASSTVAAVPAVAAVSKRRDDSLLQQQDGIQSAILHCKRSFKASRDSESSILSRSSSDPSHETCVNLSAVSSPEEAKETRNV